MASMMSITRITVVSIQPAKNPAIAPRTIPKDNPTATETTPTSNESRAP